VTLLRSSCTMRRLLERLSPTRDEFTLHCRNLSSLQGFISQRLHLRPRYVSDAAGPKEISDGKGCP
jgi:hypothetical protein